jgi:uncharacterized RDD family membrane protein YckC
VDFDPAAVRAPFLLRLGAILIDYILVVALPVLSLLLARAMGYDGARLLGNELNTVGWSAAILLGVTDLLVLPFFTGQTIGKMLTGLRVVRIDGRPANGATMMLRQIFGYLLTAGSLGIGFLIAILSSKGRALHDYIAGTVVIHADRRPRLTR